MDLSDGHINPRQLHLVPANPPLTQMHAHTKTQTNTVQHHVTVLCNAAKALNTAYGSSSPSRGARRSAGVCSASEWGRVEWVWVCVWGHGWKAAVATTSLLGKIQAGERQKGAEGIHRDTAARQEVLSACWGGSPAVSAVKHWREQQQCSFASLDWPLDISDSSRCVRRFRVIFCLDAD